MNKIFVSLSFLWIFLTITNAQKYRTDIFSERIKTIQVLQREYWGAPPIIHLNGNDIIEISFDELSHDYKRYVYKIVHCNADWTQSNLSPIEYLNGFQSLPVENYTFSLNTTMDYTNYKIFLPNEDMSFKVSGNYALLVYDEDQQDKPVLSACFSVAESYELPIDISVSSNTDIDFNKSHQQVNFTINTKDININSPQQELKVYLMQNNRRDNMVSLVQPTNIMGKQLVYNYNKKLIFDAGNEYRRFEMTTTAYNGIGIENISFHNPYFHITLFQDIFRSHRSYLYDQDQNGRFFIRNVQVIQNFDNDYDSESDYFFVHFFLKAQEPFLEKVYILGEIYNNILDSRSEMQYDYEHKAYEKIALLKQGSYNYMYVTKEDSTSPGSTALIEGNYFETENEYLLTVYHRPMGERYDRLIGVRLIRKQ